MGARVNAAWHRKHRMPRNPSLDERLSWHEAHAQACGCREAPPALRAAIARRKRSQAR